MASPAVQIKVLTYNLFWWKLFREEHGGGAAGLVARSGRTPPYDFMAFQECEHIGLVMSHADLAYEYTSFRGKHALCMAFRTRIWTLVARGQEDVAEDTFNLYYGRRAAQWMRLRHTTSGHTVFFVNHHGPLEHNSGGRCGGGATAFKLLQLVAKNALPGDAIVIAGDFNADAASWTLRALLTRLHRVYFGMKGGIDNFLSNIPSAVRRENLGGGGSDHDALSVILQVGTGPVVPAVPLAAHPAPRKAVPDAQASPSGGLHAIIGALQSLRAHLLTALRPLRPLQ